MHIAWGQLLLILVIGLIAGSGLVAVFAFGVTVLSRVTAPGTPARRRRRGFAVAGLCFALLIAAVAYGIYILLAPRFR